VFVAGVDGCRGGWLVAVAQTDPFELVSVEVMADVAALVADASIAFVAIDMPIGLPDCGPRACDIDARRLLGPRRSSVFPAPMRDVLAAADYPDALVRSRASCGKGLSIQTWNLVPAIIELDEVMTPGLQDRVRETHPELCFAQLAGGPLAHPKRPSAGRAERVALVGAPPPTPRGAATDDVLDAIALTHTAARFAPGQGQCVGDGSIDRNGLRMEIWW
jgi:predicted RNase H-like nuclease